MNKYTVIYAEKIGETTYYNFVVKYDRIQTDNLNTYIDENYGMDVWLIFEGWPKLEGEQ